MSEQGPLLARSRIAERLNLSVRTVRRWIADSTLSSSTIRGSRLVYETDLNRLFTRAMNHDYDLVSDRASTLR